MKPTQPPIQWVGGAPFKVSRYVLLYKPSSHEVSSGLRNRFNYSVTAKSFVVQKISIHVASWGVLIPGLLMQLGIENHFAVKLFVAVEGFVGDNCS
jgi:hypothetical protein